MDKKIDAVLSKIVGAQGICDQSVFSQSLQKAAERQSSPAAQLARDTGCSESLLLSELAAEMGVEYLDLKNHSVDAALIQRVPVKIATYYKFIPVRIQDHVMTIAVAYPPEVKIQDEIRTHLGFNVVLALSREADVLETLNHMYGLGADTIQKIIDKQGDDAQPVPAENAVAELSGDSADASVELLVNQIILQAYKKRATDIHLEPYRNEMRLRYRIDGVLQNAPMPAHVNRFLSSILARIKLMANMNIVERRLPQDGRAVVKVHNQGLDLRVSCIPTPHGESIVIRILPNTMDYRFDSLGLREHEHAELSDLINRPHGITFVTGPTGSGKSTTLYAALSQINTQDRKIITIEDPIEYQLEGITQIQVMPESGFDFARGLRSILRHDPDVIMVGEVRDLETAEIAIRVALTGHLVFSTLHTNDAASGITRLVDIGVEPYLIASSVNAFIGQRLLRKLCPHCRKELPLSPQLRQQIAREIRPFLMPETTLFSPSSCPECNRSGFWGRSAVYEILNVSEAIKPLIMDTAPSDRIKQQAMTDGMHTLRQSGWLKACAGLTAVEEVLRLTPTDTVPVHPAEEVFAVESAAPLVGAAPVASAPTVPPSQKSPAERAAEPTAASPVPPAKNQGADRRVFIRSDDGLFLKFRVFKMKDESDTEQNYDPDFLGVTKNISAGGLVFSCMDRFNAGMVLDMTIEMPGSDAPIQCLARVVRCVDVAAEKGYDIAACFLDLPNGERARINRYIMQNMKR